MELAPSVPIVKEFPIVAGSVFVDRLGPFVPLTNMDTPVAEDNLPMNLKVLFAVTVSPKLA